MALGARPVIAADPTDWVALSLALAAIGRLGGNRRLGVFASRSPFRPNPIGMSVVRLEKVENNVVHIRDLDILDGTPLLDIKPYIPEFDLKEVDGKGWLENNIGKLPTSKDDGRFAK